MIVTPKRKKKLRTRRDPNAPKYVQPETKETRTRDRNRARRARSTLGTGILGTNPDEAANIALINEMIAKQCEENASATNIVCHFPRLLTQVCSKTSDCSTNPNHRDPFHGTVSKRHTNSSHPRIYIGPNHSYPRISS